MCKGLLHSYSVWYPKSTWPFPNASHFKFWVWLFSQYNYQSKMPIKYPNPCLIKIPRTFLQNYLGMSRNTISSCITHMCDTHVLKKRSNSSAMIFDAAYVMGVVSMINSADDDKVSQIADLFIAGDVNGLVKMGLKKVPNFNLPPVGAVDFEENAQILTLGRWSYHWVVVRLTKLGYLTQFLGKIRTKSCTNFGHSK